MRRFMIPFLLAGFAFSVSAAMAQDATTSVPFAGGTLTITETDDGYEKVLFFEGEELARDYYVGFDRTVDVGGTEVALFSVGPGGNMCGPSSVVVWKPADGPLKSARAGADCGSPPPAISDRAIYFVPYLLPGESLPVQQWTPDSGLEIAGTMRFTPQPGTGWDDLNPETLPFLVDVFSNAAIYEAASEMLGDELTFMATSLLVSDGVHRLDPDIVYGWGCVPHSCGLSNGFMALDMVNRKLYFAQQDGPDGQKTWPAEEEWPAEVRNAMHDAIAQEQ